MSPEKAEMSPEKQQDEPSGVATAKQFARYAHVGMMFPVSILLGFFGGYLLDRWLGTIPLFAIVGLALGVAAAIRNLLQTVAANPPESDDDDD